MFGVDVTMPKKITQQTDCYIKYQGEDAAIYYCNYNTYSPINHSSNNHITTNNNQVDSTCTTITNTTNNNKLNSKYTTTTNKSHNGARCNIDKAHTSHEAERISTTGGNRQSLDYCGKMHRSTTTPIALRSFTQFFDPSAFMFVATRIVNSAFWAGTLARTTFSLNACKHFKLVL